MFSMQNPDVAPDFVAGVQHRLTGSKEEMKKKRSIRAPWSPSTISDIEHDQIRKTFFSSPSSSSSSDNSPRLPRFPQGAKPYSQYPHVHFALPSEALIGRVVKGDTPDSGSFALSKKDVLEWFEREWNGKIGTEEKVLEVLSRRTKEVQDGTLQWK